MLSNKTILITGGTGSLGRALVAEITSRWKDIKRLVVFSRDELKQSEMMQEFPENRFPALRFFLGDVRDRNRLRRAFNGIEIVIHAAALKQVPAAEYNPMEFIHTNVLGAENVIEAALDAKVRSIVALSTDKAAAPINLYGATKLCSDKLFVAANTYSGSGVRCSVVRYGNVIGSRGSVVPLFLEKARTGMLPITHKDMTRFNITIAEGVELVLWAMKHAMGGEIFVPKLPSFRIVDLAEAIGPNCKQEIIGMRPGEKLHEEMITVHDGYSTHDIGKYLAVLPSSVNPQHWMVSKEVQHRPVDPGFSYGSGTNSEFLSVAQLRALIKRWVDPSFQPV